MEVSRRGFEPSLMEGNLILRGLELFENKYFDLENAEHE